jgi:outer membrane protein assembly factor BamC
MEAEVLGKLMVHFGMDEQQAKGRVAAADGARAQLAKGELLLLQDDLDAAWRRVGQALDRTGVIIEDRDRNAGILYVRYVDSSQAGKRQGIFSFFNRDSGSADGTADSKKSLPNDRFQVRLKTTTTGISVNVFNVNGEPEESKTGERLLDVLHQQLR